MQFAVFDKSTVLCNCHQPGPYLTEYMDTYKLPYKVEADEERGTALIVAEDGHKYAVEELVAMIFQYAMKIGEGMGKGVIKDAVLAVPPWFGQTQRYSLYDAVGRCKLDS